MVNIDDLENTVWEQGEEIERLQSVVEKLIAFQVSELGMHNVESLLDELHDD